MGGSRGVLWRGLRSEWLLTQHHYALKRSTKYAGSAGLACAGSFEFNSNAGQSQGVAQGDEVAGFLCHHDAVNAVNAGDVQHIAIFGGAGFDEGKSGGPHFDAAAGDGDAVRGNHSAMGLGLPWGHASNGLQ